MFSVILNILRGFSGVTISDVFVLYLNDELACEGCFKTLSLSLATWAVSATHFGAVEILYFDFSYESKRPAELSSHTVHGFIYSPGLIM